MQPTKQDYPSWRYHPTQGGKIVKSEFEEPDAEEGWRDVPYPEHPKVAQGVVAIRATPELPCPECPKKEADFIKKEAEFDRSWNDLKKKHIELQDKYAVALEELKNATATATAKVAH